MAWNNTAVTVAGNALLQRVLIGEILTLDFAAGGSMTVDVASLMAQTDLRDRKQQFDIVGTSKVASGQKINIQVLNKGLKTEYTMKQIGIWAHIGEENPVLFALLQDEKGIYIPSELDVIDFALNFYAVIDFSSQGEFSVNVDPTALVTTGVLLEKLNTKADLVHYHEEYAKKEHSHSAYASVAHFHDEYAYYEHSHDEYSKKEHSHSNYAAFGHGHSWDSINGLASVAHTGKYTDLLDTPLSLPPVVLYDEFHRTVTDAVETLKASTEYNVNNGTKLIAGESYRVISKVFGIDSIKKANDMVQSITLTVGASSSGYIWIYSYPNGNLKIVRNKDASLPDFDLQIYRVIDSPDMDSEPKEGSTNLISSGAVYKALEDIRALINS